MFGVKTKKAADSYILHPQIISKQFLFLLILKLSAKFLFNLLHEKKKNLTDVFFFILSIFFFPKGLP